MSSELCRATCHAAAGIRAGNGSAVRMNQLGGLGDCFLLVFRVDDGDARYMLIDCGTLPNTAEAVDRIQKVAHSIAEATGGHLGVLVCVCQKKSGSPALSVIQCESYGGSTRWRRRSSLARPYMDRLISFSRLT